MSKGAVGQVIQKAIGDAAFRRQLQSDPKKALAGFDLTADERSAITSGDPGRLTVLGVDQRMSKAFNLSGISAASKSAVSPDLTGAGAAAFVDEGGAAGRASAIDTGGASANTANLRRIEGDLNVSAARGAEDASGTTSNLRRIEGDLNVSAARGAEDASGTTSNLRRIEGDLNVSAAREAEDVSGDFTAFDPGIVSNTASAARDANQSANASNLRRVEGDLNVGAARQPVDVSGDSNRLDPGIETKTSEATALEPGGADLDLGMIDPGHVSSGDAAARAADVAKDAGTSELRPNEPTE